MRCWQRLRLLPGATEAAKSDHSLLSKKSSKKGLTRRPLFLVRVDSLICTVGMIGPSRSVGAGSASGAACLTRFFLLFLRTRSCAIGPAALSDQLLLFLNLHLLWTCSAGSRGSASLPAATASANQIVKPEASSPRCSLYDPLSGSNPRLICLTNLYFGHPVPITITSP
jgi:hypothetical protein